MCGIVAYLGEERAAPILIDGLKKLEYRGYDSAGIAVLGEGGLCVVRRKGSVAALEEARGLSGKVGVGHTRWATHGAPSERNAHPHVYGRFAVVHNGIIENAEKLKGELGERFSSDTDSEVVAHILERKYHGDLLAALMETTDLIEGSFALAVLCTDAPDEIVLARRASPLIAAKGKGGLYAASDVPALAEEGRTLYALGDGEFARLKGGEIHICDRTGAPVTRDPLPFDPETDTPAKGGFPHFMRKEMAEIPAVLRALEGPNFDFSNLCEVLCQTHYIQIVACGTAYHAGLCAECAIERLARIPVDVYAASEYRYQEPIVPKGTLVVAVSQSGETADTLAAARLAKERGAVLAAVVNVRASSLAELADIVLETRAGREVAVAATKSFNAQLFVLYRLADALARARGSKEGFPEKISELAEETAKACEGVRGWTPYFLGGKPVFFIGRGADRCAALEGSLKLKEISYLPSEGYAAGELKHGTLALIEKNTPVVAVLTSKRLAEKTMNAVHETYARGAKVFLVTTLPEYCGRKEVTASVLIPDCGEIFSPILSSMPLQSLAYYVAVARGNDPDKPRNLAKSVTVE